MPNVSFTCRKGRQMFHAHVQAILVPLPEVCGGTLVGAKIALRRPRIFPSVHHISCDVLTSGECGIFHVCVTLLSRRTQTWNSHLHTENAAPSVQRCTHCS